MLATVMLLAAAQIIFMVYRMITEHQKIGGDDKIISSALSVSRRTPSYPYVLVLS